MTPAERRAALVEKVSEAIHNARLMCRTDKETAASALTVALEEAARVAQSMMLNQDQPSPVAAAIRALIK